MVINEKIIQNITNCNKKVISFYELTEKNCIIIYGSQLRVLNVTSSLLLSQIIYWKDRNGCIAKYGIEHARMHLGLSRNQFFYAKRDLISRGYIDKDFNIKSQPVSFITDKSSPLIYHRHLRGHGLSANEVLVLSQLIYRVYSGLNEHCSYGYSGLLSKLRLSKKALIDILKSLKAKDFLDIVFQGGRNVYRVNFDKLISIYQNDEKGYGNVVKLEKKYTKSVKNSTHIYYNNIINNNSYSKFNFDLNKNFKITEILDKKGDIEFERVIDYFSYKLFRLKRLEKALRRKIIKGYFYIIWYKGLRNQLKAIEFFDMDHLLKFVMRMISVEKASYDDELFIDWLEFLERIYENETTNAANIVWDKAQIAKSRRGGGNIAENENVAINPSYHRYGPLAKFEETKKVMSDEERTKGADMLGDLLNDLKLGRLNKVEDKQLEKIENNISQPAINTENRIDNQEPGFTNSYLQNLVERTMESRASKAKQVHNSYLDKLRADNNYKPAIEQTEAFSNCSHLVDMTKLVDIKK